MEPLLNETKKNLLETNSVEDKQKLLIDVIIIEKMLTSIYEDLKKLNAEIIEFKVDSYSEEKSIAKKIINSIDDYLFNRKKCDEEFQDKPDYSIINSKNSLTYNPETQRYLNEFKLLLNDITFNEEKIIGNNSVRNCSSSNQTSEMETIYEKTDFEAAIDDSLLDIVKHVQTGRQWFVKEYEESE